MEKIINFLNIKPNMYAIDENGNIRNIISNRYLSNSIAGNGYYTIGLQLINNSRKVFYNHILVAIAYLPNPKNYPCVNHKDLNKFNNNISNLEWCSFQYNNKHATDNKAKKKILIVGKGEWSNGAATKGERNGMHKWSESLVRELCQYVQDGYTNKEALSKAGIEVNYNNEVNLRHIVCGLRWKSVSKDYDFSKRKHR